MALYSEQYWYPDGTLAANLTADVFERGVPSPHAALFSDPALSVPLANPASTDGSGMLVFYAAPGDYEIHIGGLSFDRTVNDATDKSWHAVVPHVQSVASDTWTMPHDLNCHPSVTLRSPDGTTMIGGQIDYPSLDLVIARFNSPRTGFAELRR